MAGLTNRRRWHIRNTFLQRRESYSRTDAARRTGVPRGTLTRERYSWPELIEIATGVQGWTLAEIHEALGANDNLPQLLALETLTVKLPAYQVAMLQRLADEAGIPVGEWLTRHLREVARAHEVPVSGYAEARDFPRECEMSATGSEFGSAKGD